MSSLSPKDRVSLCSFTFADGRRCRTPRSSSHPHFCFYHAQKEARACAAQKLGKDLDYFFSGDYLSACDLSTALARLIPAVVRGEVKPKTAHTVAYLFQTLMQAIHISQHEYSEAFSDDAWRKSIRNSVKGNYNYRFPPAPQPAPPAPPQSLPAQPNQALASPQAPASTPTDAGHPERSEGSCLDSAAPATDETHSIPATPAAQPVPPPTQAPEPAPSPHTPLPPTSAEFVQQVMAGLPRFLRSDPAGHTGRGHVPPPVSAPPQPQQPSSAPPANPLQPTPVAQPFRNGASGSDGAPSPAQPQPQPHALQSAQTPIDCHSERSRPTFSSAFAPANASACAVEESASSSAPPLSPSQPAAVAHPARGEESASSSNSPLVTRHSPLPPAQPNNPPPTTPPAPPPSPNRDAPWLHFGDPGKVRPDSHLL